MARRSQSPPPGLSFFSEQTPAPREAESLPFSGLGLGSVSEEAPEGYHLGGGGGGGGGGSEYFSTFQQDESKGRRTTSPVRDEEVHSVSRDDVSESGSTESSERAKRMNLAVASLRGQTFIPFSEYHPDRPESAPPPPTPAQNRPRHTEMANIALLVRSLQELTAVVARHGEELRSVRDESRLYARRDTLQETITALAHAARDDSSRTNDTVKRVEDRIDHLERRVAAVEALVVENHAMLEPSAQPRRSRQAALLVGSSPKLPLGSGGSGGSGSGGGSGSAENFGSSSNHHQQQQQQQQGNNHHHHHQGNNGQGGLYSQQQQQRQTPLSSSSSNHRVAAAAPSPPQRDEHESLYDRVPDFSAFAQEFRPEQQQTFQENAPFQSSLLADDADDYLRPHQR
eukprot:CAMPEP_0118913686 /NCGR_PEP_ID=MMETSP1166-20130328/14386_1 /TAXON_ID=1104430 /ORGANISM="Chrysoreinhardia sp, Strain CCMP3193" /LENGTH=398 /DNA_ID=CAMNT_0006853251 /DNA_START=73 /DNA_END=1269 /DNA_ORIENTATION=-